MQPAAAAPSQVSQMHFPAAAGAATTHSTYQGYQVIRRNGAVVVFEPNKVAVAMMKAFLAVHGT